MRSRRSFVGVVVVVVGFYHVARKCIQALTRTHADAHADALGHILYFIKHLRVIKLQQCCDLMRCGQFSVIVVAGEAEPTMARSYNVVARSPRRAPSRIHTTWRVYNIRTHYNLCV